jgi:iron(III) transport system substrate-binding protein
VISFPKCIASSLQRVLITPTFGFFLIALCLILAGASARASDQDSELRYTTFRFGRLAAATIEAAKKEGSLMIYNSMTPSQMQLIINAFRARYPFVEVKVYRAVGERLLMKILTEAQAGRRDFDVLQSGDTQAYFLKKKNLLAKYVSPEVKYLPKILSIRRVTGQPCIACRKLSATTRR